MSPVKWSVGQKLQVIPIFKRKGYISITIHHVRILPFRRVLLIVATKQSSSSFLYPFAINGIWLFMTISYIWFNSKLKGKEFTFFVLNINTMSKLAGYTFCLSDDDLKQKSGIEIIRIISPETSLGYYVIYISITSKWVCVSKHHYM